MLAAANSHARRRQRLWPGIVRLPNVLGAHIARGKMETTAGDAAFLHAPASLSFLATPPGTSRRRPGIRIRPQRSDGLHCGAPWCKRRRRLPPAALFGEPQCAVPSRVASSPAYENTCQFALTTATATTMERPCQSADGLRIPPALRIYRKYLTVRRAPLRQSGSGQST